VDDWKKATSPVDKKSAKLKLLYKFMYVYYGHPQAVVKIKPKSSNNISQGGSR
jgi:hypothetical protein